MIYRPTTQLFRLGLIGTLLVTVIFGAKYSHRAEAQTSDDNPQIASIQLTGWTSTTATINFSLNIAEGTCLNTTTSCRSDSDCTGVACVKTAEAQIEYGPTTKYGSFFPASFAVVGSPYPLTLTGLQPSTTYHYRLKVRLLNGETVSDTSGDRTFTTRSGDNAATPTVSLENVTCTNNACTLTFSTAIAANVQVGWDTVLRSPASPEAVCDSARGGYPNCARETDGSYLTTSRSLRLTDLATPATYHYRLSAIAQNGATYMTGNAATDLTLTTNASSTDRTFSTGGCTVGVRTYPIGTCLPTGETCTANGAVADCTSSCGYNCPAEKTCTRGGACLDDPSTRDNSPYKCNKTSCYENSSFKNPADAGCYASWPKCTANTILKVIKDRACNMWLTCGTSVQTTATKDKPGENLCLSLAACNQLGLNGQCAHYLPQGQCDNDPLRACGNDKDCEAGGTCNMAPPDNPTKNLRELTFSTPEQVKKVANLSGSVTAGLDWGKFGGSRVIQGSLPWQSMRQIGGNVVIRNGDLETNAPDISPWVSVPENQTPRDAISVIYEDQNNSPNHVLKVTPVTQYEVITKDLSGNDVSEVKTVTYSGAASLEFTANPSEYYYAEARIRSDSGTPLVRFQLGFNDYNDFAVPDLDSTLGLTIPTYVDINANSAWQRVTIGPIKGLTGTTRVAAVCADNENCGEFWIDDVQVKPALQINTNPEYVTPSCRLYPRDDAPSCDYTDLNGVTYKGWRGYCLEKDSQTDACVSWWPVDIIQGESSIFGTDKIAGYQDRTPLYMCAEAVGLRGTNQIDANTEYVTASNRGQRGNFFSGIPYVAYTENDCDKWGSDNFTIGNCDTAARTIIYSIKTTDIEYGITEDMISRVYWDGSPSWAQAFQSWNYYNTPQFQPQEYRNGYNNRVSITRVVSDINPILRTPESGIYWLQVDLDCPNPDTNCTYSYMKFDTNTHQFLAYGLSVNDNTGDETEDARYRVRIYTREQCTKIVKVVEDSGANAAFAGRVTSKVYKVADLGYGMTTNVVPFAGMAIPEDQTNPIYWPLMSVETKSGEFENGQSRSGAPYACKGDCSNGGCKMNDPQGQLQADKACDVTKTGYQCGAVDSDLNGNPDSICTGGIKKASFKGPQLFDNAPCDAGTCRGTGQCVAPYTAVCEPADKTVNGPGNSPTNARSLATSSCTGSIACSGRCGGAGGTTNFTGYAESGITCTAKRLVGGTYTPEEALTICQNNNLLYRLLRSCACVSTGQCTIPDGTTYQAAGIERKACTTSADCHYDPNRSTDNANYFAQERIKRLFTKAYGIWEWQNGRYVEIPGGWTPPLEMCPVQEFTSGQCIKQEVPCTASVEQTGNPNASQATAKSNLLDKCKSIVACDGRKAECTSQNVVGTTVKYDAVAAGSYSCVQKNNQWTCTGRCTASEPYWNASYNASTVTKTLKGVRPTTPPDDYCANAPQLTNVSFTSATSSTAIIDNGGGNIGLKFNVSADIEQVPLQTITIDWGDGSQYSGGYPYAPRTDPRNPYIFGHPYNYNNADLDHCQVNGPCRYHIKIQVKDGWGWCNESAVKWCSNNQNRKCITNGDCGTGTCDYLRQSSHPIKCQETKVAGPSNLTDTTHWVDSGLEVVINP